MSKKKAESVVEEDLMMTEETKAEVVEIASGPGSFFFEQSLVEAVVEKVLVRLDSLISSQVTARVREALKAPAPISDVSKTATSYEEALSLLGLIPSDIASYKEYPNQWVILPSKTMRKVVVFKK